MSICKIADNESQQELLQVCVQSDDRTLRLYHCRVYQWMFQLSLILTVDALAHALLKDGRLVVCSKSKTHEVAIEVYHTADNSAASESASQIATGNDDFVPIKYPKCHQRHILPNCSSDVSLKVLAGNTIIVVDHDEKRD